MTEAYPYVLEGKYIVSADLWGPSTGSFHDNWTGDNIPSHTVDDPDKNTVSRKFEVARSYVAGVFNAQDAKAKCASYLENGSGWRLPTFAEQRVMLFKVRADLTAVAAIKTGWHSSCTMTAAKDGIWCITGYNEGGTGTRTFAEENFVRCVRDWGERSPYVKDGKYIVFQDQDGAYDDKIHPNWAAADMPAHTETDDANAVPRQLEIAQSNASTGMNWENAKAYCQYLYQDGSGWRLPTLRELDWMYRRNGALTVTKVNDAIWSGTNGASSRDAWTVNFSSDNGKHNNVQKTMASTVRCVRDLGVLSYPYVLNGNTIVFSDDNGSMPGATFHDVWNSDKAAFTPAETGTLPHKLRLSETFCNAASWSAALEACRAYSERDIGTGLWRLPTPEEANYVYKARKNIPTSLDFWPGTIQTQRYILCITVTDNYDVGMTAISLGDRWQLINISAIGAGYNTRCVSDLP